MREDWIQADPEEFSGNLQQRTEELYRIPNAQANGRGMIECNAFVMRDMLVLPHMISPVFIGQGSNNDAIRATPTGEETLIALIQKDPEQNDPGPDDFLEIGVEIAVGRVLSLSDGNSSALVQGRRRVEVVKITQTFPFFRVRAKPVVEDTEVPREVDALMRATRDLFEKCVQLDRSLPDEAHLFSINIPEPGWLADMIATAVSLPLRDRLMILKTTDPAERLRKLNWLLAQELDVLELEDEIQSRVQNEVDRSQREFYLREQLKAIQNELGEGDVWTREVSDLRSKLEQLPLAEESRASVLRELDRLSQMPSMAPEVGIIRTYLDWIIDLPWAEVTEDNLDVRHAAQVLNANHYGLKDAKDRILEYIAVRSLKPKKPRQPILCFTGPPGTGKTSLGKSIAEALGRKFVRVSLGGVRDEAEIRGHRRTYIGAMPGRILQTMRRAGTLNPLFMLDEIDKIGADFRGDPSAALLEVLDPEQNFAFSDHYLEIPYDLSQVMFITTANTLGSIPPALLDRMEVIEFSGYIEEDKLEIARRFLIPRQLEESGLDGEKIEIKDSTVRRVITSYTYEAGVRNLERELGRLIRKLARQKSENRQFAHRIVPDMVERFLGPPEFFQSEAEGEDEIGVATGMAWTEMGGEIMPIEVVILEGKGNLQITGQIGEIMQESAQAGLSYLKAHCRDFDLEPSIFENLDIHIHVPEGAVPKDGPSAGITIATAVISAFSERKVYKDVAMSGEITLRGKVLPVGGVREKVLAAHRAGLKKVILPERNRKDLIDVPKKVLADLKVITVTRMAEVLETAIYGADTRPEVSRFKPKPPNEDEED